MRLNAGCVGEGRGEGKGENGETYVASKVMYVPPMAGSAILA